MQDKDFEQLSHTADLKIRVYGTTRATLFEHAVVGMFQVIRPIIPACRIEHERIVCDTLPITHEVEIRSIDEISLLVDFLSEALYLSDVHNEAYLAALVHEVRDTYVRATLYGIGVQGFEVVEIKAVTYHELEIKQVNGMWQADIVFDI
jgi:SHS2 domain-containing protein